MDEKKFVNEYDRLCSIFKNLRFPIINMTKEEMLKDSKNKKFDDVLYKTWSCWYPIGWRPDQNEKLREPCGICPMCKQRIIPTQPQTVNEKQEFAIFGARSNSGDEVRPVKNYEKNKKDG